MAKNTFLDFSTTPSDNQDIAGIGILGTNAVRNFDDAFRNLMSILRRDLDNGTVFVTKSAGYTAVAGDNNAFYEFTATATLALTAAATLAADWHMMVFANGGVVTVDPNSAELINGAATLTIANGDAAYIICTGTAFKAIGIPSAANIAASIANKVDAGAAQTFTAAQQAQARTNISAALKGQLFGLTLTTNSSDAANDVDIAPGEGASEETNPVLMVLASTLTKRLDANWAVGSGNGGLDTGSVANSVYYIWLIQRSDTGVVDALFSLSSTAPTMPTNYDRKRLLGTVGRISAANYFPAPITNGREVIRSERFTNITTYTVTNLSAFDKIMINLSAIAISGSAGAVKLELSDNNGSSWYQTQYQYNYMYVESTGPSPVPAGAYSAVATYIFVAPATGISTIYPMVHTSELFNFNKVGATGYHAMTHTLNTAQSLYTFGQSGGAQYTSAAMNALRITATQNITGAILIEGIRG